MIKNEKHGPDEHCHEEMLSGLHCKGKFRRCVNIFKFGHQVMENHLALGAKVLVESWIQASANRRRQSADDELGIAEAWALSLEGRAGCRSHWFVIFNKTVILSSGKLESTGAASDGTEICMVGKRKIISAWFFDKNIWNRFHANAVQ